MITITRLTAEDAIERQLTSLFDGKRKRRKNDKNNKIYIEDPQVGDVYSITTEKNGYYSSLKISEIKNDSVFVIFNDYEIDKRSKIYKIDKDQIYTSDSEGYTKSELKDLFNKGIIYDIDRN